ncbi:MAG: glycosyltransferase family 2 protein [Planctomycetes bacterium]|nr:glycosyltransferase family 2 protein [Planctomycetota bacterium]
MNICAVIPGYNEAKHISEVIKATLLQVDTVLVVDDGSSDGTGEIAKEAGAQVLRHDPNQGKGASLRDGLDWALENGFDAAITLDADGQHLPEEIARFVEIADKADMIIGNRMTEVEDMPWVRLKTNRFMSWVVSKLARTAIPDSQSGFRFIKTAMWKELKDKVLSRNFDFESEIIVAAGRNGYKVADVPISTIYGDEVSKINPVNDTIRFFKMVWRLRK